MYTNCALCCSKKLGLLLKILLILWANLDSVSDICGSTSMHAWSRVHFIIFDNKFWY